MDSSLIALTSYSLNPYNAYFLVIAVNTKAIDVWTLPMAGFISPATSLLMSNCFLLLSPTRVLPHRLPLLTLWWSLDPYRNCFLKPNYQVFMCTLLTQLLFLLQLQFLHRFHPIHLLNPTYLVSMTHKLITTLLLNAMSHVTLIYFMASRSLLMIPTYTFHVKPIWRLHLLHHWLLIHSLLVSSHLCHILTIWLILLPLPPTRNFPFLLPVPIPCKLVSVRYFQKESLD